MTGFGILLLIIGIITLILGIYRKMSGPQIIIGDPMAGPNAERDIRRFMGLDPGNKKIIIGAILSFIGLVFLLIKGVGDGKIFKQNFIDHTYFQLCFRTKSDDHCFRKFIRVACQ